VTKRETGKAKR